MLRQLIFGFVILSSGLAYCQTGHVEIIKDNRINALISKQSKVIPPEVRPQIDGYRVQVFFDSEKSNVLDAKGRIVSRFSKLDTYISYNAPNYFLKVGDFRTRLEAERIKSKLEAEFPTSFIISEKVNLPRLEKDEIPE